MSKAQISPGTPVRQAANFEIWNDDIQRYFPRTIRGWAYRYNGSALIVFPIGVLAAILRRSTHRIRCWERTEQFPAAIWVPKGRREGRYYSEGQIRMVQDHFHTYLVTPRERLSRDPEKLSLFFAAVLRDWLRDFETYGNPRPEDIIHE